MRPSRMNTPQANARGKPLPRARAPGGSCFKLKSYMRPLVAVWLITLILGVSVYFNLYGGFRVFAKV